MIVPKLISSKVCAEMFYSKTGIQTELLDDDLRLWASEAYLLIGSPMTFIPKVVGSNVRADYAFKDYSVQLPCDFHKLIPGGISVNGVPVKWRSNAFHHLKDGDCCNLDYLNTPVEIFTDNFGNQFSPSAGRLLHNQLEEYTFDIVDDRMTFNVKTGELCLAYWSLPIDNEGYVMIPDTAKFKRAITDYLIWCNDYILWRQDSLKDKVYQTSEANKEWSISSAISELKVPDVEQTESIKDLMIRLKPAVQEYNRFFRKTKY